MPMRCPVAPHTAPRMRHKACLLLAVCHCIRLPAQAHSVAPISTGFRCICCMRVQAVAVSCAASCKSGSVSRASLSLPLPSAAEFLSADAVTATACGCGGRAKILAPCTGDSNSHTAGAHGAGRCARRRGCSAARCCWRPCCRWRRPCGTASTPTSGAPLRPGRPCLVGCILASACLAVCILATACLAGCILAVACLAVCILATACLACAQPHSNLLTWSGTCQANTAGKPAELAGASAWVGNDVRGSCLLRGRC